MLLLLSPFFFMQYLRSNNNVEPWNYRAMIYCDLCVSAKKEDLGQIFFSKRKIKSLDFMVSLSVKCMKHSKATETIPRQRLNAGNFWSYSRLLRGRPQWGQGYGLISSASSHCTQRRSGSRAYVSCIAWVSHVANTVSPFVQADYKHGLNFPCLPLATALMIWRVAPPIKTCEIGSLQSLSLIPGLTVTCFGKLKVVVNFSMSHFSPTSAHSMRLSSRLAYWRMRDSGAKSPLLL